ncbi:MAG: FAD-dependent oxidoreductase [Acidobacteriota bacterium]
MPVGGPVDPALRVDPAPWLGDGGAAPHRRRLAVLADEILRRCRGEGPANCVARCPLHVDARGFVQLTGRGEFRAALRLVREHLPFPAILGHLCAHPCELHCKRIDEDGAVRIRDLERFLAESEAGPPEHVLDRARATGCRVAVVGSGPAGLLAAHDLARRGHTVTLVERDREMGGCLVAKIPSWRLPRRVVERDLSIIPALGVTVRTGVAVGTGVTLDELRGEHDAVVVAVGREGAATWAGSLQVGRLGAGPCARIAVDPMTGETAEPGVFAAGDAVSGLGAVIDALASGRRAAESAHRFLVGGDLRGEREPLQPGGLLWTLAVTEAERKARERTPALLQPFASGLVTAQAVAEARRCLDCHCDLCVEECDFLAANGASPKELARRVTAGLTEARTAAYSCNLCSLCGRVCPESLDTGEMLLEARRELVRRGDGPLPQHHAAISTFRAGVSTAFALVMPEPGRQRSRRLFFTGCALPASSPRGVLAVYDALRRLYPGTGVLMYCCGAPVELLGMEEEAAGARAGIIRLMEDVGADELIAACPGCLDILAKGVEQVRVSSVWELLADGWELPHRRAGATVAVHDSCRVRDRGAMHDAIRTLLARAGASVEVTGRRGDLTRCCGSGGMVAEVASGLAGRIAQRCADESPLPLVTACADCRAALASRGKDTLHLVDFLLADDWRAAASRPPAGAVARYANRLRTKFALRRLRPLARQ